MRRRKRQEMPSVSECQAFLTDREGRIASVFNTQNGFSSDEAVGRLWHEFAPHGPFSNDIPDLLPDRPATFSLIGKNGKRVTVEAYPRDDGHHFVLLRPESFPPIDAGRQRMVSLGELV